MSYGTVSGVAALSSLWTDNGYFLDDTVYLPGTRPSFSQVEDWMGEISSTLDLCLEDEGFITPVTETAVLPILSSKVQAIAKDMCDFSHGAGRFFSKQSIDSGTSPMMTIENELRAWVKERSLGFEAMGVARRKGFTGRNVASFDVL